MKYVVVLCDGMADYPVPALGGKTPMMAANKPNMDYFASKGEVGLVKTVADGLKPGSDVANLSVMGYDPLDCYSGRSPLEAASIGINLQPKDVALRCNLVTLSDETAYEDKTMVDYCAGDISTEEAAELIHAVQEHFGNKQYDFYPGVSYRHCLVWHGGTTELGNMTPPHDISGKMIGEYLSDHPDAADLIAMMKESHQILKNHPVNQARVSAGKRPANSIWLWGQGRKPKLIPFAEKFGIKASVVSAVDLIKGIGKCAEMNVVEVEGATGYIDTNFTGKVKAAIAELNRGQDLVYLHFEAPDECGHRGETENKVKSIEMIDTLVLGEIRRQMESIGPAKIMILPDHPTPIVTLTHSSDPVPYIIYSSGEEKDSGISSVDEESAKTTGVYLEYGPGIMGRFLGQ